MNTSFYTNKRQGVVASSPDFYLEGLKF